MKTLESWKDLDSQIESMPTWDEMAGKNRMEIGGSFYPISAEARNKAHEITGTVEEESTGKASKRTQ